MATIFERAFQYAYDKCGCRHCNIQCKTNDLINMDGTCDKHNAYRKLYAEIATEQRKIDIENACDFMYNFTLPNGVAPLYDYTGNLRKAMEE